MFKYMHDLLRRDFTFFLVMVENYLPTKSTAYRKRLVEMIKTNRVLECNK